MKSRPKGNEHDKYNGSLRARKSVHFFDDVIVCLGSDIENENRQYPTETTVFQLACDDEQSQAFWKSQPADGKTWIDPMGTGYYVPQGARYVAPVLQQSRTENTDKPTEAVWTSLLISHGKAPKGARYEYAVLPQTTPEKLHAFAAKPSYTVIEQDRKAHIVRSDATGTLSYVIFETPRTLLAGGPVLKTDTTCLAMVRMMGARKMVLTVAQPDLALYRGPADVVWKDGHRVERSVYGRPWRDHPSMDIPVTVTLLGKWSFTPTDNIRLVAQDNKTTTILIDCKDGKSYDIELTKNK